MGGMVRKKSRKLVQIALLLLSAMFIATASAAVYNLMYMEATVTAKRAKVYFDTTGAEDAGAAGTQIGTNGTYVKFTSLSGWPNATRVYEKVVFIRNDNTTADANCILRVVSVTGAENLDVLKFKVNDTELDALSEDNNIVFTIPKGSYVVVGVELKFKAGVEENAAVQVTLELKASGELE